MGFVIEMGIGLLADSTALIADSLDMLADAVVYGVALYAIGKSLLHKANAARISGFFLMAMGAVALVANVICLVIIRKQRNEEVHMRASWIFSANDVIANLGVISAGVLVFWLDSRWPDLVIGVIVSCVVLRGAKMILKDAGNERQRALKLAI